MAGVKRAIGPKRQKAYEKPALRKVEFDAKVKKIGIIAANSSGCQCNSSCFGTPCMYKCLHSDIVFPPLTLD